MLLRVCALRVVSLFADCSPDVSSAVFHPFHGLCSMPYPLPLLLLLLLLPPLLYNY